MARSTTSELSDAVKVGMIGSRGILSTYSGIETGLRSLCPLLAVQGANVCVYGEHPRAGETSFENIAIVALPALKGRFTETLSRSFLATLHGILSGCDILHYHDAGPGFFAWIARLFGKKTVLTLHSMDWQRAKWGRFSQLLIRLIERAAVGFADEVVTVSETLNKNVRLLYGREVKHIANGVSPLRHAVAGDYLRSLDLRAGDYVLFAGRLVPEKGVHDLIAAFASLNTDIKLVIAGGSRYGDAYAQGLQDNADGRRVVFTGHVGGQQYCELLSNAYAFVLPSYVEGQAVALLEAIGLGLCALVSDIPENLEVVGDRACSFKTGDVQDLARKLKLLIDSPETVHSLREKAAEMSMTKFNWGNIATGYLRTYASLLDSREERI